MATRSLHPDPSSVRMLRPLGASWAEHLQACLVAVVLFPLGVLVSEADAQPFTLHDTRRDGVILEFINDRGYGVGKSLRHAGNPYVLWLPEAAYGLLPGIHVLPEGFQPKAMNDAGQIVGFRTVLVRGDTYHAHGHVWDRGEFYDIMPEEKRNLSLLAVNDHGVALGWTGSHIELYDIAEETFMPVLTPRVECDPAHARYLGSNLINDLGQVLNIYYCSDGEVIEEFWFVWEDEETLHRIQRADLALAFAMNNRTEIAGAVSDGALGVWPAVWRGSVEVLEYTFGHANDINDHGMIVGQTGQGSAYKKRLWLLEPVLGLAPGGYDLADLVEGSVPDDFTSCKTQSLYSSALSINARGQILCGPYLLSLKEELPEPAPLLASTANLPHAGASTEPVNTFTGELFFYEAGDLDLGGPMPLSFDRYYAGFLGRDGRLQSALGPNWAHTFDWRLIREDDGPRIEVVSNTGGVIAFEQQADAWQHGGSTGSAYQLREDGAGYRFAHAPTQRIYTFDAAGRLVAIEDGRGNAHTLVYADGQLVEVSDGLGRKLSFAYQNDGHLASVSDGSRTVTFGYARGQLVSVGDVLGGTATYAYVEHAEAGLLAAITRPRGNTPVVQTYDTGGRVVVQTDAQGNTYTYAYGDSTTLTDPLGHAVIHAHDEQGQLRSIVDEQGKPLAMAYNAARQRISTTDRLGGVTSYAYDGITGGVSGITLPDGTTATVHYATRTIDGFSFYDPARIIFPGGTSVEFEYDARGNLISWMDQARQVWAYTYNGRGQVLTATSPTGARLGFTYHSDGTRASLQDAAGNVTTLGYDALRRNTSVRLPDGSSRSRTFDAADRVTSETDEMGRTTTYDFDANSNLLRVTYASGAVVSFRYDEMDRLISLTDPLGATSSLGYDARGNIVSITDGSGHMTSLSYDPRGFVEAVTDAEGYTRTFAYDAAGRLLSSQTPAGHARHQAYDAAGLVTQTTSPLGHSSHFHYDAGGNFTSTQLPSGAAMTLGYDERGLLTDLTLPEQLTASFTLSSYGHLERLTDARDNVWLRTYDGAGRLTAARDPLGREHTYGYDSRNRLTDVGFPDGRVDFTYDAAGNLTSAAFSDGLGLAFAYDAADRLTRADGIALVYNARGDLVESNGLSASYDPARRLDRLTWPGGETVTYTYNRRGLLEEVRDWAGGVTTLTYDADGHLAAVERPNGIRTEYTHDADGRVVGITNVARGGDGTDTVLAEHALTRNELGNIVKAQHRVLRTPALREDSLVLAFDAAYQVSGYDYDAAGRLLDDGIRTYEWDLASRLRGYTEAGETVSFSYDAFGNRLTRTQGDTMHAYVWNYALTLPVVSLVRQADADHRFYIHTPDGLLLYSVEPADSTRRFFHFDERGNTLFLTDDAGTVRSAYAYSPYGRITASGNDENNPFTFLGQYGVVREGNDLYRMRRRLYDARTARFLSPDPLRQVDPQAVNPYTYASQNPLRFIDPIGADDLDAASRESSLDDMAAGGAGIVSTASYWAQGAAEGFGGAPTADPNLPRSMRDLFTDVTIGRAPAQPGGYQGRLLAEASKAGEKTRIAYTMGATRTTLKYATEAKVLASEAADVGRAARGLNALGNAATVVGAGVEGYHASSRINEAGRAASSRREDAFRAWKQAREYAWIRFQKHEITQDQLRKTWRELDQQLANQEDALFADFLDLSVLEATVGFGKALDSMLPNPAAAGGYTVSNFFGWVGGKIFGD